VKKHKTPDINELKDKSHYQDFHFSGLPKAVMNSFFERSNAFFIPQTNFYRPG